ncbi:putative reverse transcriptase domain-containing protein [Tanacetum coccineum]
MVDSVTVWQALQKALGTKLHMSTALPPEDRLPDYADKRRKPLEFKVGDRVLLKVSPWKGVVRFGKKGKLAPRYVELFEIVECVGPIAYRLKLPQELSCVHDTFHVSNLKKCLAKPDVQVPLDEIEIDENLRFVEEPIEIVERDVKKLKRRRIPLVKVRWNSRQGAEFTWEHEDQFRKKYMHLFSETVPPSGRTFTIVGNMCSLTRITSNKIAPPKETIIAPVATPTSRILVYIRRPKATRVVGSSSKVKIVESKTSNSKEPNQSWGSTISNVPFSSLNGCRLYKLFSVKFGNDHIANIMGYGDYQMGNVTISRVYYVEGLGHNLFSVGQFCYSDLEVAFCKHTCFIRDLDGVDLLKGSRDSNLYTLSMDNLLLSSLICLLSKASKTKSWLWHRRLPHLNFDYITSLAKHGLVRGLPKLKYQKDHLCSAYALVPTGKVIATVSIKVPTGRYIVPAGYIISPDRKT